MDEARKLRATYFSLSEWDEAQTVLGRDNMWYINESFLMEQTMLGKTFILKADPATATGYFAREVEFLKKARYTIKPYKGFWRAVLGG